MEQDWESGWTGWGATNGIWELCQEPSSNPDTARSGEWYVVTVCGGSTGPAGQTKYSSLLSPQFVVPTVSAGQRVRLRFWSWFSLYSGAWRIIILPANDTVAGPMTGASLVWGEYAPIDLTQYEGNLIQVSFEYRHPFDPFIESGVALDDILVELCVLCVDVGPDKIVCKGDSVQLSNVSVDCGQPAYFYSWSPCDGLSDCNLPEPYAAPDTTTTYVLTVTDSDIPPATTSDTIVVTVLDPPILELSDTTVYVDQLLCIDPDGVYDSCRWNGVVRGCTICTTFTSSGDYTLSLTVYEGGCSAADTMLVHVIGCIPPSNMSATDDDCDKVVVTWVDNGDVEDGYRIYRDGSLVGTVATNTTLFTDYPQPGMYTYCVRSFCGSDSSEAVCDSGTRLSPPSAPASCSATDGLCGQVTLTWSAVLGATAYHVYRDGVELTPASGIPGTTYVDTYCDGVSHTYAVRASNACGKSSGSVTNLGSCIPELTTPVGCAASDGAYCDLVEVTWDTVVGAESYLMFRNDTLLAAVTGPPYEDRTVAAGEVVSYAVQAVNTCDTSGLSTSDAGHRAVSPEVPSNLSASNDRVKAIHLGWSPASFATSYCVYRNGSQIGCTEATTYVDWDVVAGQWYSYCVTSVNDCGESNCSGVDSGMALSDIVMADVSVYPNPTGDVANITYTLYENAEVTIEVYTLRGRKIREFTATDAADGSGGSVGTHVVAWDLKNGAGSVVANGVYICQVTATGQGSGKTVEVKKKVSVVK